MRNDIQGVGVALVTPFHADGEVDYRALENMVDYTIGGGVDYIVALGTTAETPALTHEERLSVVSCIKERNAGRVPLIVGIGGFCTQKVIENIRAFDLDGVRAILSVTPYYNKPSQEGLYRHYEAIAGESPVPVLLYNVPSRTGVNMEPETTLRIAHRLENVIGIKEACGTVRQMSALLKGRPEGFSVISGDDCMALPLISIGGDGVISVAANAFPHDFTLMTGAAFDGDINTASSIYMRLFEAMEAIFEEGNPVGVKAALAIKGIISNNVRLPLNCCSTGLETKLRDIIGKYGI